MNNQLQMFEGTEARNKGIKKAINTAERKTPNWADVAYDFLKVYIRTHNVFMVEDVRKASTGYVPTAGRAWGGIVLRAAKMGLIEKHGMDKVKNPKAHCANANVWRVVK